MSGPPVTTLCVQMLLTSKRPRIHVPTLLHLVVFVWGFTPCDETLSESMKTLGFSFSLHGNEHLQKKRKTLSSTTTNTARCAFLRPRTTGSSHNRLTRQVITPLSFANISQRGCVDKEKRIEQTSISSYVFLANQDEHLCSFMFYACVNFRRRLW